MQKDGIVKDMDELMVEATNKVMNNLPTKYKNKSSRPPFFGLLFNNGR